jgi:hypothetical protein
VFATGAFVNAAPFWTAAGSETPRRFVCCDAARLSSFSHLAGGKPKRRRRCVLPAHSKTLRVRTQSHRGCRIVAVKISQTKIEPGVASPIELPKCEFNG